jgi:hypothetical protein
MTINHHEVAIYFFILAVIEIIFFFIINIQGRSLLVVKIIVATLSVIGAGIILFYLK